jgi:hypothetical protein
MEPASSGFTGQAFACFSDVLLQQQQPSRDAEFEHVIRHLLRDEVGFAAAGPAAEHDEIPETPAEGGLGDGREAPRATHLGVLHHTVVDVV